MLRMATGARWRFPPLESETMTPDQQQPQGPGGPPPRRGFLPRNPFLVIAMILAAVIFIQLMFTDEPSVEI